MKQKYALFAFYIYYPKGGFDDFVKSSNSFDDLFIDFRESDYEAGMIVDMETFSVIHLDKE